MKGFLFLPSAVQAEGFSSFLWISLFHVRPCVMMDVWSHAGLWRDGAPAEAGMIALTRLTLSWRL